MLNQGLNALQVAEYLLLDEKTVRKFKKRYLEDGVDSLCDDFYEGRQSSLTVEQEDQLVEEVQRKIYPTTSAIRTYIKSSFNIDFSISGVNYLLHRLGFSYKKPQAIPGKANAKAQIELKTNTGRKRVTINGALELESKDILIQEDKVLNAENTIKFFKKIERKYQNSTEIHLVLDNAGYYKGEKIRKFLETSKITLNYLPPYAPNLNLIERVWKFFKKKVLANRYYESFLEFRDACLNFFKIRSWRSHRAELESLLVDNFQIINAV